MESPFRDFLKKILVFSLVTGLIALGIGLSVPAKYITPVLPLLFVFFIGVTLAGYYFLIRSAKQKFIKFLNSYLLITTLKLLLFIGVLVSYIMLNKKDAAPFGISFFLLYLVYTLFEVVSLVSYSRTLTK